MKIIPYIIFFSFVIAISGESVWISPEPLDVKGEIPPPRVANSIVSYQQQNKTKLLIFGGTTYFGEQKKQPEPEARNDVYKFDIETSAWIQTVENKPNSNTSEWDGYASARSFHSAIIVPEDADSPWRNTMVVYGGSTVSLAPFLAAYNLTTDKWLAMNETGLSPQELRDPAGLYKRTGHIAVYSKQLNAMIMHGGSTVAVVGVMNDTWKFDLKTLKWEQMVPKGPTLPEFCFSASALSPNGRWLYIYSGSPYYVTPPVSVNQDLYLYDIVNNEIRLINTTNVIDAFWGVEMVYVPGTNPNGDDDRIWLWSFQAFSKTSASRTTRFFQYDIKNNVWIQDYIQGTPSRGRYWAKCALVNNDTLYYTFGTTYYVNTTDNDVYVEPTNWMSTIRYGTAFPLPEVPSTNSPSNPKDHSTVIGLAVGIPVGLTVVVGVIVAALLVVRHRKHKRDILFQMDDVAIQNGSSDQMAEINDVVLKERLGGGNFGDVYRGLLQGVTPVACKKLKDADALEDFLREAKTLQELKHPNVVQFLGVFTEPKTKDQYIVTEYLPLGSLRDVLLRKKYEGKELRTQTLIEMCKDAAAGMTYISEHKKMVHNDLALRNLLAGAKEDGKYIVKVADVGSSRTFSGDREFYKAKEEVVLPLRWSAPESIKRREFTVQSDVWSFGVTMWEVFSYGSTPYEGMSNSAAAEKVLAGHRLTAPSNMPHAVSLLMSRCFEEDPEQRPPFKTIFATLNTIQKEEGV